jgi:hypothetical protein
MKFALFYEIPVAHDMQHEDVMRSIELFGKHVIPEFSR